MHWAVIALGLTLGLCVALLVWLVRETRRRRSAEGALQRSDRELEGRVQRRTAELTNANNALQVELNERRQVEAALRASEERYRIVADNAYAMEYWLDPDLRFVYVSPSCERITGYPPGDFAADPDLLHRLVHPDDRSRVAQHQQQAARGDPAEEIEFRLVRRDGTERWVAHACQPFFDSAGQDLGRRASLRDITPRKHAEAEIHRLNRMLELRVATRTAELKATVERLEAEVAERRRADEALRKAQERFSGIFHASKDAIAYANVEGVLLEVNEAYCRLTGYPREELVGVRRYQDLTPPEFHPVTTGKIEEILRTGVPQEYEKEFVRKDGTRVPIGLTIFVVPGDGDRPAGLAGIIKDISERKHAERALQRAHEELETRVQERTAELSRANEDLQAQIAERLQAEARLQRERNFSEALVDSLPGVFYLFEVQGRFLRWNKNLEHVTGYSAEEIARMHPRDFFVGTDQRLIEERIREVFARGESTAEAQLVSKDGARRPYFFTGQRVVLQRTAFLVGMGIDITERKRAEEALAAQQHLLETILEQAADGILVRDAQGRVLFANAAMKRLAWRPPEGTGLDVAGEVWGKTTDGEGKTLSVEEWPVIRALRGETVRGLELHRIAPDGTPYVFLNSCAPVRNDRGEIIAVVAINTDITDRKAAEERLTESLKEKEALLQEVHHRVKNNLQLIASLLHLQAREIQDPALLGVFEESRARIQAMALIHERLYRTRHLEAPDYRVFLNDLVGAIGQTFGQPNVNITCEVRTSALGLDARVAVPIGLIVNELVSNSLKHGFPGGRAGRIMVRLEGTPESGYVLSVHDNGVGLPADVSIQPAKSMGLRLVDMLARQLKGRVAVQRDEGTGFWIHFDVEKRSEGEPNGRTRFGDAARRGIRDGGEP